MPTGFTSAEEWYYARINRTLQLTVLKFERSRQNAMVPLQPVLKSSSGVSLLEASWNKCPRATVLTLRLISSVLCETPMDASKIGSLLEGEN